MMRGLRAVALVGAVAALLGLHACEGKQYPIGPSLSEREAAGLQPDESVETSGVVIGDADTQSLEAGSALGAPCVIDVGCESGYCVGGRCCESACDGVCQACSEAGRCDLMPADDDRCPVLDCGPGNACAAYPEQQAIDRCASLGACKTTCDPTTVAVDTVCGEAADGIERVCAADGSCVDPRAAYGAACQSERDCVEGVCVDGVCCREACDGPCESCDASGTCIADAAGASCGDGLECFGRGSCLIPNGEACEADADCGSGQCEPALGGGSACCAEACANGLLCDSQGECVSPQADLGNPCATGADCLGGSCVDGVCCDSPCGAACERCNGPGQAGRCTAEPAGSQDPACATGLECGGRGQCLRPLGATCALDGECRSGACSAALQGNGEICCEAICQNGQRCAPNGSCVEAPRPNGATCVNNADCGSNSCVAGRCCESACNGVCESCSGLGTCNLSPGNDPRCAPIDCPASNTVCVRYPQDVTTNLCASFGTCRTAQQECRPAFAAPGTACEPVAPGVAGVCDGQGNCADPRAPQGTACTQSAQCLSGNCVPRAGGGGNVCCDSACNGVCEACSNSGACGFRDNGRCPPGSQCATRTTCQTSTAPIGGSCVNGEACEGGAACVAGVCREQCRLGGNGITGSLLDQCVLAL